MAATIRREKTKYPGVFYRQGQRIGGSGEERIYYIVFKKDGKVYEEKVGRQFADGMTPAKAANIRSERVEGKRKSRKEVKADLEITKADTGRHQLLADLWSFFQQHRELHSKSLNGIKNDAYNYRLYLKPLERRKVEELATSDVLALRDKLIAAGKSPQTVKHILSLLRRIIRLGVKHGKCPMPDPSKLVFEMPKVDNQKTEYLTPDHLERLIVALEEEPDQDAAGFVRLALATGMRKGAILGLKWEDVDFERGFITLSGETAKNNKTLQIPMNTAARRILEGIAKKDSPYVFPGRNGNKRFDFRRVAKRVKLKAGLPTDFRPLHGLRHSFASFLASSGKVDLYTLQRLLTHSSPLMTQRYAHLADEALQRASSVADSMFNRSVHDKKAAEE